MSNLLRLEKYELRTLSVTWHDIANAEEGVELVPSFNFEIASHAEDPRRFALRFDCSVSSREQPRQAFEIATSIVGYFSCPDDWEEDTCAWRATDNGCVILYGILRGLVASITAQFPYGAYYLPTVDMRQVIRELLALKNKAVEAKSAKKASTKRVTKKPLQVSAPKKTSSKQKKTR